MIHELSFEPPNSLICVWDAGRGQVPDFVPNQTIQSTPSCINIFSLAWVDGPTHLVFGSAKDVMRAAACAFDRMLETPSRSVVVSTVEGDLFSCPVPDTRTRVRIWLNRPWQPDEVVIAVG